MITPTEDGFHLYLRTKHSDKEISIRVLFDRYAYLIDQVSAPVISVADLTLLYGAVRHTTLKVDEDPIDVLTEALTTDLNARMRDHDHEQAFNASVDDSDPPFVSHYSALIEKVGRWSPLRGLKVIEAVEYIAATDHHEVDITPAVMRALLRGKRDKTTMHLRRTPLSTLLRDPTDDTPPWPSFQSGEEK